MDTSPPTPRRGRASAELAPLRLRALALVVDLSLPLVCAGLWFGLHTGLDQSSWMVLTIVTGCATAAWCVVQLLMWRTGAGLGHALARLRPLDRDTGHILGLRSHLVRAVVLFACVLTVVPGLMMFAMLLADPLCRGWHDRLVDALVCRTRPVPPVPAAPATPQVSPRLSTTVGLPPHVLAAMLGQPDETVIPGPPIASAPGVPRVGATGASRGPAARTPASRTAPDHPLDGDAGTRMAPRPVVPVRPHNEGWFLRFDDGRELELTGLVLVGRHPEPRPDEADAELVTVAAGGVSKVHFAVGVDKRGVHVTDRGSTNGTALVNQHGDLEPCPPHVEVRAREGQVVSFSDRSLILLRH